MPVKLPPITRLPDVPADVFCRKVEWETRKPVMRIQDFQKQGAQFRTTHWTVIEQAAEEASLQGSNAREAICRAYWFPLYSFIRRKGHDSEAAQDLTQAFFLHLLTRSRLKSVGRAKGKFRTFLLCALNNFLLNEWDRSRRLKRGAGYTLLPFDAEDPEERYRLEPFDNCTPELAFDRQWAKTVVARVLSRLRDEVESGAKIKRFDGLKGFLLGDSDYTSYAEAALHLGMTEQGVKGAVLRLRRHFGELLRQEVGNTVSSPEEVNEEIKYLLNVLAD
jgi:RNA polymerase sigma factor (sigma-70 family)